MNKLRKWILRKLGVYRDEYIFERMIDKSFLLTLKDKEYLKRMGQNKSFMDILDKINAYIVYTGMSATTKEGLMQRNEWVKCMGFLKNLMTEVKTQIKPNRITNKPK